MRILLAEDERAPGPDHPAPWEDAFRAGGYAPETSARFIAQIRRRIDAGLALQGTARR